jgi:endonuclease YncB( thermonuclease family)
MKHLAVIILCWTVMANPVRVIDGDTFVADVKAWLGLTTRETVRVRGVNTPEIHGATKAAGMVSRQFTIDWLAGALTLGTPNFDGSVTLTTCGRDAFGRVLADIKRGESNLSDDLIGAGLGVDYRRK